MKKILTVGAVTVALAALPMAGVYAADPTVTDNIQVTVSEACTLTRSAGEGTYTVTMNPNQLNSNVGTSTLSATCNAAKGYTVTLATTNLVNQTSSSYNIPYGTTTPVAGTAAWTVTVDSTNIANGGTVMSTTAADSSTTPATESATYKVSTSQTQATGTYRGTATYTLTKNN